jgi:hypothetical protein
MYKLKQVEIEENVFMPFKWLDDTPGGQNLGRAEFLVCLKMLHGKLKEFWVSPRQQRGIDTCWHCHANDCNDFHISSYESLQSVGAWLIFPCKEHKALAVDVYAPSYARYLQITPSGIAFWKNDYTSKPFTEIAQILNKVNDQLGIDDISRLQEKLIKLDSKELK